MFTQEELLQMAIRGERLYLEGLNILKQFEVWAESYYGNRSLGRDQEMWRAFDTLMYRVSGHAIAGEDDSENSH